jgi:hypothetical protein
MSARHADTELRPPTVPLAGPIRRVQRRRTATARTVQALVFAIVALTFLNPLFLKLQGGESSYAAIGFGSFLGPAVLLLSLRRIPRALARKPRLWLLIAFPLAFLPGTIHSGVPTSEMLRFLALWVGYGFVALAVASWADHIDFPKTIFWAGAPIIFVLLGLSLLKHYTNLPVPYLNELPGYDIQFEAEDATVVRGLVGPFLDRTQAAMLLEGITAFLLGYLGWTGDRRQRMVAIATVVLAVVFMMHSTNRSFFLSLGLTMALLLTTVRWFRGQALRRWLPVLAVLMLSAAVVAWRFRAQFVFYVSVMMPLLSGDPTESGSIRLAIWENALELWSFLGWGPLGIPVPREYLDPGDPLGYRADTHSNFVFFFWRGGVFGVMWLLAFALLIARNVVRTWRSTERARFVTLALPVLASLFFGGIAHTSIPSQLLWIFIGVFVGSEFVRRSNPRRGVASRLTHRGMAPARMR